MDSIPGRGTKIPHASHGGPKKEKKRYPTSLRLPAASSLHMLLLPAPESLTLQKHKMAGAVEPSGKERGKSLMF